MTPSTELPSDLYAGIGPFLFKLFVNREDFEEIVSLFFRLDVNRENRENNMPAEISCSTV